MELLGKNAAQRIGLDLAPGLVRLQMTRRAEPLHIERIVVTVVMMRLDLRCPSSVWRQSLPAFLARGAAHEFALSDEVMGVAHGRARLGRSI
jgi:hypothetical protein